MTTGCTGTAGMNAPAKGEKGAKREDISTFKHAAPLVGIASKHGQFELSRNISRKKHFNCLCGSLQVKGGNREKGLNEEINDGGSFTWLKGD